MIITKVRKLNDRKQKVATIPMDCDLEIGEYIEVRRVTTTEKKEKENTDMIKSI